MDATIDHWTDNDLLRTSIHTADLRFRTAMDVASPSTRRPSQGDLTKIFLRRIVASCKNDDRQNADQQQSFRFKSKIHSVLSLGGDGLILTFIPYRVNNARQLHDNDLQSLGH